MFIDTAEAWQNSVSWPIRKKRTGYQIHVQTELY